jgi:hypothetical protein
MQLKVPIPRRPQGLTAEQQGSDAIVALSWQAALDADGAAVEGYNVYRRLEPGGSYALVNAEPVADTEFVDTGLTLGTRYYYVVRAVDALGVESVDSESVSIVIPVVASLSGSGSGGGGGGGGCFISSAQTSFNSDLMRSLALLGVMLILGLLLKSLRRGTQRTSSSDCPVDTT